MHIVHQQWHCSSLAAQRLCICLQFCSTCSRLCTFIYKINKKKPCIWNLKALLTRKFLKLPKVEVHVIELIKKLNAIHYEKVVVEVAPAASASLELELPLLPWLLPLLLLLPPLPLLLLVVPPPPLRAGPNPFAPTPPVTLDFFPSPS